MPIRIRISWPVPFASKAVGSGGGVDYRFFLGLLGKALVAAFFAALIVALVTAFIAALVAALAAVCVATQIVTYVLVFGLVFATAAAADFIKFRVRRIILLPCWRVLGCLRDCFCTVSTC